MAKLDIKNRYTGEIIYQAEAESFKALVEAAVKAKTDLSEADLSGAYLSEANLSGANLSRANLSGANLSRADLSGAYLSEANLSRANLSRADLSEANLSGANLSRADLSGAYLSEANLSRADLSGAYLSRANLSRADLSGANLSRANLSGAYLSEANLSRADLSGADLSGAYLSGAYLSDKTLAETSILPDSGPFVGWKKCRDNVIVRLAVPSKARRSNSTGRKCRAEYVKVLEVMGAEVGISQRDSKTEYRKGKIVRCDKWNENRWEECSGGIHFFITRYEAENY